jgi:hypothetical protein
MPITLIVGLLALVIVVVAAVGMRRERVEHPAGAQSIAVMLAVVVAALILAYLVLRRAR